MKNRYLLAFATVALAFTVFAFADENHEKIEKVMKEGMKGDESPLSKVIDGVATAEETTAVATLINTLHGTTAPVGAQASYDEKVAELIAAIDAVAGGTKDAAAIERLDNAANCKACHNDHKPKE